jgi:6-phosphogluconolactonase (cycloisomerase 2 family)
MAQSTVRHLNRLTLGRLVIGLVALAGVATAPFSPAWAAGEIYVTNNNTVAVFARPAGGNTAPLRVIGGAATGMSGAQGIAVDTVHDEVWVANIGTNSITVYPRTATGNVAPLRTITGAATSLFNPIGLALDLVNDEVIVANIQFAGYVTTYPRTANGNVAPLRNISGVATGLTHPWHVLVDPVNDELYVSDAFDRIRVFARTATGNIAPIRSIVGAATGLSDPFGLALDLANDELFVANISNDSVAVYSRTANGNVPPLRTLSGAATGLNDPTGVALDGEEIVVVNRSGNSITAYPREATGNTAPLRTLVGAATGFSSPSMVAVFSPVSLLISTGTGPTGSPHVKLFQFDTDAAVPTEVGGGFFAYDGGFTGGVQATIVRTAAGVFVVTGVGSGGGPHIKLFKITDLATGAVTQIGPGFMAYDLGFTGGARVAATADEAGNLFIITGVGSGGAAHVKVFKVTDLVTGDAVQLGAGFFAYDPGFLGGVNVGVQ